MVLHTESRLVLKPQSPNRRLSKAPDRQRVVVLSALTGTGVVALDPIASELSFETGVAESDPIASELGFETLQGLEHVASKDSVDTPNPSVSLNVANNRAA